MTLMNSLLMFAQQGGAAAGQAATTSTTAPAPSAPLPSADQLAAARAHGATAMAQAAGQQEVSLLDLVRQLNPVEMGVMIILALCAIYAIALLFEKIYVMRKAARQ